jgi:hypothetical protein
MGVKDRQLGSRQVVVVGPLLVQMQLLGWLREDQLHPLLQHLEKAWKGAACGGLAARRKELCFCIADGAGTRRLVYS